MVLDYAADKPEFLLKPGENAARALSVDLPNTKHHAHAYRLRTWRHSAETDKLER
jgi:hypothetical protein